MWSNVHATPVLVFLSASNFFILMHDSLHFLQYSCISITTAHHHHHPADHQLQNSELCCWIFADKNPCHCSSCSSFLILPQHSSSACLWDDHLHLHLQHLQHSVSPQELLLLVLMVIWIGIWHQHPHSTTSITSASHHHHPS